MKKQTENANFQTHIAEPKWQQVISVVVVVILVLLGIYFGLLRK